MPLSRRYRPEWSPGELNFIGFDWSPVIPPGVGIIDSGLTVYTNTVPPQQTTDFEVGEMGLVGRISYTQLSGGVDGTDYQLLWGATDSNSLIYWRKTLLLCAYTS